MQQPFSKFSFFNGLAMVAVVLGAYAPIHALPNRHARPEAFVELHYRPVALPRVSGPLRLAGAWELTADEPRFGGLSALAISQNRFLAISDLGAVIRFEPPSAKQPMALLQDLRDGPGNPGKKSSRDAESLLRDPRGRGWWVGFEQRHSLWLYDEGFRRAVAVVDLERPDWRDNRGAEGLLAGDRGLLALAENGLEAVLVAKGRLEAVGLEAGAEVADAARAPDGSAWLLLRSKGRNGISQSITPLVEDRRGLRIGPELPLPKHAFDNFEGMAIAPQAGGAWRFWLVTDDGHRFMARTLLVALDLADPPRTGKARRERRASSGPSIETP